MLAFFVAFLWYSYSMISTKIDKKITIGIVAPSRPIIGIENEIKDGIDLLIANGFNVKIGKNVRKKSYYMAGTPEERVSDIHDAFSDDEIDIVIAATGGSCSNQILNLIDYRLISKHKKTFIGYSDITNLLFALHVKSNLKTVHGPDIRALSKLDEKSLEIYVKMLKNEPYSEPIKESGMTIIKPGTFKGKIIGGNITLINGLLATPFCPDYQDSILFWEEIGEGPAMIDFKLNELKLSGVFDKISGMIIGHLDGCEDLKHPEDNRSIDDIVLETVKEYNFPIAKANWFGHGLSCFYPLEINADIAEYLSQK